MLVYDQITFCFLAKGLVGNACRCFCCFGNGISIHAKDVFVGEKRSQSAAGERAHRSGTVLFDHVRAYTSQLFFFFVRRPIAVEDIYGDDASVASRTTLGLPGNDRLIVGTAAGAPTLGLSPQPFLPPIGIYGYWQRVGLVFVRFALTVGTPRCSQEARSVVLSPRWFSPPRFLPALNEEINSANSTGPEKQRSSRMMMIMAMTWEGFDTLPSAGLVSRRFRVSVNGRAPRLCEAAH